jgi:hypothetical protein
MTTNDDINRQDAPTTTQMTTLYLTDDFNHQLDDINNSSTNPQLINNSSTNPQLTNNSTTSLPDVHNN